MNVPQADLFEHGIQTEKSDIRAHVSPLERQIYVFKTGEGVKAITKHNPRVVDGYQNGVVGRTASGWLVKPAWITDLRTLKFISWTGWEFYDPSWSTSEKGAFAISCVRALMEQGRFPIWIANAVEEQRREVQIAGTDILLFCKRHVQVKCDEPCGKTGNLFLQKAERNPLKRH